MSTIQNRKNTQDAIQQIQQDKAEKKKQLAQRSREEMKELKESYQQRNQELDSDSAAAISHIQTDAHDTEVASKQQQQEERAEVNAAQVQTYNRRAQLSNSNGNAQQASMNGANRYQQSSTGRAQQASVNENSGETKSLFPEKPAPLVQNYVTRDTDQFYHVQDRGSRLSENTDGYVIEAYAPDHEKANISMMVHNNKAVLSGKRKFQDSVDEGQKKISTNNFQTYHEEFRFDRPVVSEGMTRERAGDFVRFFIPKLEATRFDDGTGNKA